MHDFFRVVPKKRTVVLKNKKGVLLKNPGVLGRTVFYAGCFSIIASVLYLMYLFEPLARAIFVYETGKTQTAITIESPAPTPLVVADKRIIISIPKIHAEAEIMPKVLTQSKNDYMEVLKSGKIAHAIESSLPGSGKGTSSYLFAHSTEQDISLVRKNSVFYLLDTMINGDVVYIRQNGQLLLYKVYDKQITPGSDVSYLNYKDAGKEVLILQTCWPLGTNWKRLLVFAQRV